MGLRTMCLPVDGLPLDAGTLSSSIHMHLHCVRILLGCCGTCARAHVCELQLFTNFYMCLPRTSAKTCPQGRSKQKSPGTGGGAACNADRLNCFMNLPRRLKLKAGFWRGAQQGGGRNCFFVFF